jgi:hypothetical protein
MPTQVYNARYVSEDTNMWDGNESYGVYTTLDAAQNVLTKQFRSESDNCRWLPVGTTYTGVNPAARTWRLFTLETGETWDVYEPDEDGEYPDDTGFGLYVIEEELRDA